MSVTGVIPSMRPHWADRDLPTIAAAGLTGGIAAVFIWISPWMFGLVLAGIVFSLAFNESQGIIVLILAYLLPINVVLGADWGIRDAGLFIKFALTTGYFFGRMVKSNFRWRELLQSPAAKANVLFVAAVAVSVILGIPGEMRAQLRGVFFVATYFGVLLLIADWARAPQQARRIVSATLITSIPVGIFGFFQKAVGGNDALWGAMYRGVVLQRYEYVGRPPSFFGHPTAFGSYLVLILTLALSCIFLSDDRDLRRIAIWATGVGAISLLITESRGPMMGMAIVLVLMVLCFARGFAWKSLFLATLAGAVILTVNVYSRWDSGGRFQAASADTSLLSRVVLWGMALKMFQASPIHGYGIGMFTYVQQGFLPSFVLSPIDLEVHNVYLELLAETGAIGLVGFLLMLFVFAMAGRKALHANDSLSRVLGFTAFAGTAGVAVFSVFDQNILWSEQVASRYWLLAGLLIASESWKIQPGVREALSQRT